MPDQINKVSVEGVTYQITPSDTGTFTGTSNDASSPSSWTSVALLVSGETNGSIFTKISSMFKNIRYLYDKLGGSDLDQSSGSVIQQLGELYSGKADINHTHNTATTAAAGFMPVLDGDSTKCLLGDGSWGSAGSTYATVSTAAPGLAPTLSGETTEFLRGDGTWASAGSTYATVSTAAPGLAPTLNGNAGYYLNGTGAWTVPPNTDTNTTYAQVTTAAIGLCPKLNNNAGYYLNGTGNWTVPPNTNTTYAFSNGNPTLAWGTKSTVGTVGGVALTVTMPSNPNTNTTYGTNVGCYGTLSGTTLTLNTRNFRV